MPHLVCRAVPNPGAKIHQPLTVTSGSRITLGSRNPEVPDLAWYLRSVPDGNSWWVPGAQYEEEQIALVLIFWKRREEEDPACFICS